MPFQMEQKMDALHKLKSSQFKKTMEVRKRCLNVKGKRLAIITSTVLPQVKGHFFDSIVCAILIKAAVLIYLVQYRCASVGGF